MDAAPDYGFLPAAPAWAAGLGRLRDTVRQQVLRSQLAELTTGAGRPLRILDVGCGQGTQAIFLAREGHEVTGLDISTELLALFRDALAQESLGVRDRVRLCTGPGEEAPALAGSGYDLVLCHGVLMYLADPARLIAALTECTASEAMISVLVRNGLALAIRDALLRRWRQAVAGFDGMEYVNRLGRRVRAQTPSQVDSMFAPLGWHRRCWFGVRVFTDHLDEPAPGGAELEPMLAAERLAGRRDPYRQVAALLHLVYQR
jgi:S-adenosylmethionine-dependent methyltransferase